MAKIKMDVSEWEALKEERRLLKKSLERGKELNKKIQALTY